MSKKNNIHVIKSDVWPYLGNEKKFGTSCSGNTITNVWPNGFQILKKQTKSENHEICQDLVISYVDAMVKIEKVSHNMSHTMFTNRSISQEEW